MPLLDIKDAGILAGFTRWGWPWHGIISGGEVGSTGQPHAQPAINESYLIDMGLPALDISPELAASEAAQGREWRNYALLPRGTVYNRDIGASSFIHIDTAGKAWRIDLTFSFPAAQTLRITADITEFGVLQTQGTVAVTVQKTVDVVCAEIELGNSINTGYAARYAQIEDVWTNGSKALVGVILVKDNTFHDLFSVVTLTMSGAGGATGSGLALAAVESIAQPGLTTGTLLPQEFTYSQTFSAGVQCIYNCTYSDAMANGYCQVSPTETYPTNYELVPAVGGQEFDYLVGLVTHLHSTAARYAYFGADGSVKTLRLRGGSLETMTLTPTSEWVLAATTVINTCGETQLGNYATRFADYKIVRETGWWLMENDTVIDRLSWVNTEITNYEYRIPGLTRDPLGATSVNENQGSLAAYLPSSADWIAVGGAIDGAFRSSASSAYTDSDTYIQDTSIYLGLHRMNSKSTAFIVTTPTEKVYGLAVTALGALSVGMTPAVTTQFAWQRKTGEHTFASNPICYV